MAACASAADAPSPPDRRPYAAPSLDVTWDATGPLLTVSSPRPGPDLDGDEVADLVTGHGLGDDSGVNPRGSLSARSGATGQTLWEVQAADELVGTVRWAALDDDGVLDAVLGGRGGELLAVSGATGEVLWRFADALPGAPADSDIWNFYSPQILDDLDGDGIVDLLVTNGGDATKGPLDPRPPGHVMVVSGATGDTLATADTPDGAETYTSPVVVPAGAWPGATDSPVVLFGTGGETHDGGLWAAPLSAVLAGDLSLAAALVPPGASGEPRGVIAPPCLVDLTGDGRHDVVVATMDGRLLALDGADLSVATRLWDHAFPGHQTYATPAVAQLDGDGVPDIFALFSEGAWPVYQGSVAVAVSGASGQELWRQDDERIAYGSPIALDLGADGEPAGTGHRDEVLWLTSDRAAFAGGETPPDSVLQLLRPAPWSAEVLQRVDGFAPSTPWAGDLDGDGVLELVRFVSLLEPTGLRWVGERLDLGASPPVTPAWTGYLGARGDALWP